MSTPPRFWAASTATHPFVTGAVVSGPREATGNAGAGSGADMSGVVATIVSATVSGVAPTLTSATVSSGVVAPLDPETAKPARTAEDTPAANRTRARARRCDMAPPVLDDPDRIATDLGSVAGL